MSFESDLEEQVNKPTETADEEVIVGNTLTKFRFYQWAGYQWAEESDRHPVRPGVLLDLRYGYNLRSLGLACAKQTGRRVDSDGTEHELTPEQWDTLWRNLPGASVLTLCDAVWALNEHNPREAVDAARKASRARSATA